MAFDLAAYLERIALQTMPLPDREGLAALQRAHRLAIPFENLDVRLGRPIRIDSASVFDKLVTARRGGFCFEQGPLFLDALAALGFTARPLLGRVLLGLAEIGPRTHTLALVTIEGQDWIADVGFGGSYAPPMPLVDGAMAEAPDGALWRLEAGHALGWMLLRDGPSTSTDGRGEGEGWVPQYAFTLDAVFEADCLMGAHFAATFPASRFVQHAIVSLPLPTGFASLIDRRYRRKSADQIADGVIDDPRVYRIRLGLLFGLQLSAEEVAALGLF